MEKTEKGLYVRDDSGKGSKISLESQGRGWSLYSTYNLIPYNVVDKHSIQEYKLSGFVFTF